MTATDYQMLIELASEGLDYREHNGENVDQQRRVLDQAKTMAESPAIYWSNTSRPVIREITPEMVQEIIGLRGEEKLVAVMPDNQMAYRERCRWLRHGLIVRTQKTDRGHCVFARRYR